MVTEGYAGVPLADGRVLAQPAGHLSDEERDGEHLVVITIGCAEFLNPWEFIMFLVTVDDELIRHKYSRTFDHRV